MSRYVIVGAGAIGGTLGANLSATGQDVLLIARGHHYETIEKNGLRLDTPGGTNTYRIPIVDDLRRVTITPEDVLILAVKSQDTADAVSALAERVPASIPVFSFQNGIENERIASRHFSAVYGAMVITFASYTIDGIVQVDTYPTMGICDIGKYPSGADEVAQRVVDDLGAAAWSAEVTTEIMDAKYGKLIDNLGMATQIIFDPRSTTGTVADLARKEAVACLKAAGIHYRDAESMRDRRQLAKLDAPAGWLGRGGASTWQSIARGSSRVETDYINGEIVLQGRLLGVPTPVNQLIQEVARQVVTGRRGAASMLESEFLKFV